MTVGMERSVCRRRFVGTAVVAAVAGCVSDASDDESGESCHLESGQWAGVADPITTTAELDDSGEIERQLAHAGEDAAFETLDGQFDIDLAGAHWIRSSVRDDGETATPVIVAAYTVDRDGEIHQCPDPSFDARTARERLPASVTVTATADGSEYEREYSMELQAGEEKLD